MSVELKNGKVVLKSGSKVSAPSPGEIAARAYDLATERAIAATETLPIYIPGVDLAKAVREYMDEARADVLAALRESVINPGPIPWWKK